MEKKSNKETRERYITYKKKPVKFQYQYQSDYKGSKGEVNNEPSKTVPDMALTVKELLQNHSRGILTDTFREPLYFDAEIPNFDDITEEIAYKEELKEKLKDIENVARKEWKDKKAEKDAKILKEKKALQTELKNALSDDQQVSKKPETQHQASVRQRKEQIPEE